MRQFTLFKAACSEHWTEGQEKVVRLPDTTPKLFGIFTHWAYSKELVFDDVEEEDHPRAKDLGSVWGLANFLQAPALRNRVIDRLLQKQDALDQQVPMSAWNHIWDQSPPDSTIRRVLIDIYLARLPPLHF